MSTETRVNTSPPHGSGWNAATSTIQPLYNLFVAADEVVLTVDLPYANQKSVKLKLPTKDSIEVFAATTKRITFHDLGARHRHGEFTSYHTIIRMPVPVNEKRATRKFKKGLLEVHLPRTK